MELFSRRRYDTAIALTLLTKSLVVFISKNIISWPSFLLKGKRNGSVCNISFYKSDPIMGLYSSRRLAFYSSITLLQINSTLLHFRKDTNSFYILKRSNVLRFSHKCERALNVCNDFFRKTKYSSGISAYKTLIIALTRENSWLNKPSISE